jgi:UDP-glucose 4-epimerase
MALRYFNVAGADSKMRTGQSTPRATHLIKRACQVALKRASQLDIFGTDYPTPDGTGVRDFIHVEDLIAAHLLALDALRGGAIPAIYNCGYGRGYSVRQIVGAIEKLTGTPLPVRESPRRPGDPALLIADSTRLQHELHWRPKHDTLEEIVRSAFEWERRFN